MMKREEVEKIKLLMQFEKARKEPPQGFPALPEIPAGRYTDQRFYDLEIEHVWRKTWLLAGHMDEFPEAGSFRKWDNVGQPVFLIRTKSGNINAFYNSCRHRGGPIVFEDFGRRSGLLTCKYHGWSYDHDGALRHIRDSEDFRDVDPKCRPLVKIRCETYGNFIFVNFDDDAPSLKDWLGPFAEEWEQFQLDKSRLAQRHIWDLDCNWKVVMEANTEVYHIKNIHAATVGYYLDDRQNVNVLYPNGHGRMFAPRMPGHEHITGVTRKEGAATAETVGEIARGGTLSYNVFPNFVCPMSQYAIPPVLYWPMGPNKCRVETWTAAPDWRDGEPPSNWTVKGEDGRVELNQVMLEDLVWVPGIQKSMESYGFKGEILSYQESRIYHWHQAADRMIGIENIPPELRVGQVIGPEWIFPNDPRMDEIARQAAVAAE